MNHDKTGRRRRHGASGPPGLAAAAVVATTALAVATLGAGPAVSAPGGPGGPGGPAEPSECPPAATTVTAGQEVTGKTVSSGTTPEAFEGEVIGVLDDYLAPDFDLIVVRLTSPEIDRVGGIWQGMSGSPVYDDEGHLLGAVAYGFAYSPSPVAGLTPAGLMQEMLSTPPDEEMSAAARKAAQRETIDLPGTMERRLVAAGDATASSAASGLRKFPATLSVSGNPDPERLGATLKRMGLGDARVFAAGAATAGAPSIPVVSGGNVAGAVSYGDYSWMGVGTATAVCGEEVLAFGHPMLHSGASTLSMHGADTLLVQEDPNWVPYKLTNPGAPVGAFAQDRLAGALGVLGAPPPATDITSTVVAGSRDRTGTTYINVPEWVADLSAWHLWYDQERIFDAHAKGSQTAGWTVTGLREDGTPFAYSRADRFADPWDIVWSAPDDLYMQLYRLLNTGEQITIDEIDTTSVMRPIYEKFTISRVRIRAGGEWRSLPRVLRVRPGVTKRFLVTLTSKQLPTRYARLRVTIPRRAARWGSISFRGGNTYGGWEDFWWEPTSGSSFDKALKQITSEPRNDDVVADLRVRRRGGGVLTRSVRVRKAAVVDGQRYLEVRVIR